VEDVEVIISGESTMDVFVKNQWPRINWLTDTTMHQYSDKLVIDLDWKTTTLKNSWKK